MRLNNVPEHKLPYKRYLGTAPPLMKSQRVRCVSGCVVKRFFLELVELCCCLYCVSDVRVVLVVFCFFEEWVCEFASYF